MSFIKDSSIYFISSIITMGLTFGSLPILTRYLSPADYGIQALFIVFGQITIGVLSLGLNQASYKFYFDYKQNIQQYKIINATNIIANLSIFIFFGFIIFEIAPWLGKNIFQIIIDPNLIKLSYFSGCLTYFISYINHLNIAQEKARLYSIIIVFQSFMRIIIVLFLIYFFTYKYEALIYGMIASQIAALIILVITLRGLITTKVSKYYLYKSIRFSFPQIPTLIIGVLYSSFDKIILSKIGGVSSVGNYSFGVKFSNLLKIVMDSLSNSFNPLFQKSGRKSENLKNNQISDYYYFIAYVILFNGLFLILFSEEIVKLLTTEAFYPAMYVIPVYVFYHLFGILGMLGTNQILRAEKLVFEIPTVLIGLTINILLNILLIPSFGIIGAAIATSIAALSNNLAIIFFGFKVFPVPNIKIRKFVGIYSIAIIFTVISYVLMFTDYIWFNKIMIKLSILISQIIILYKLEYLNKSKINNAFRNIANL